MEAKNFKQALALQKELSTKLTTNMTKLRKSKAPTVTATLKEQEKLIAAAKAELGSAEKERKLTIIRLDQRVERRQATITRLEAGLKEMKKGLAEIEKAKTGRSIRKKRRS